MRLRTFIWVLFALTPLAAFAGPVTCSAAGSFTFNGRADGSAVAFFYPDNNSLSATATACLGAGAHFNWYQIVTADPMPPRSAGVPYTDPQPGGNAWVIGGWRDGLPWYYDEVAPGTGIGCVQGGVDTCQFYSGIAWAVNSPCITYLTGQPCPMFNYTPTRDLLVFSDTPQNPLASIQLSFQTRLVIVSADQSQWAYVAGFAWDWSNPSPLAGVASNFRALTSSELTTPPAARQGGGPPSPFDTNPPAHSSLGFPPNPVYQESLVTPEPSSFVLIGLGLMPLAALRRFRSRPR